MGLSPLAAWLLAYLFPGISVLLVLRLFPQYRAGTFFRGIVVHGGLLLSTILSQYLLYMNGLAFPWDFSNPSLLLFGGITIAVAALLGRFGIFYALSALLQQATMTSIAYYLLGSITLVVIILLVVPFYALSHLLQPKHWHIKIPVTFLWGALSLALFSVSGDLFLNASLHAIAGALLIYYGITYPQSEFAIKRATS